MQVRQFQAREITTIGAGKHWIVERIADKKTVYTRATQGTAEWMADHFEKFPPRIPLKTK